MSIETRGGSIATAPAIRAGGSIARGGIEGGRSNGGTSFATNRIDASRSPINIPKPGEKPGFMSISKRTGGEKPLFMLDGRKPNSKGEKAFAETLKIKQAKSQTLTPRNVMGRPVTEVARRGDKTFSEAMKEKQAKGNMPRSTSTKEGGSIRPMDAGVKLDTPKPAGASRPEIQVRPVVRPDAMTIRNAPEGRPVIEVRRPTTPLRREAHGFYQPTNRPEMTRRVVIKPQEVVSSQMPSVKEQTTLPKKDSSTHLVPLKTPEQSRVVAETKKPAEVGTTQTVTPETRRAHLQVVRPEQIHTPEILEKKSGMTQIQAVEALKTYAKTPKAERKTTPEVKQAFQKVLEPAKTPLASAVTALWQDKEATQPIPGVSPEALTYLKTVIDKNPDLKRQLDTQLQIATTVMANYAEIGYPINVGGTVVLRTLEMTIRKAVREALKPKTAHALPEEDERDGGGDDPKEEQAIIEEEQMDDLLSFMRDEKVNGIRVKELLELADYMGIEDEEQKVKIVSPKTVAQVWKLTTQNVSPIIRDGGTEQRRVDGSWDEIVKEMETWQDMSMTEFKTQVRELIKAKTAVAQGENPYATEEDVQRVVTVPIDYSAFKMNKQRHEYQQAA
jgi:hypothetical protein